MYLDCTLRDGGYYTNWDFDTELVESYLQSINELPVDIIEVGYRGKQGNGYKGEYFHLPEYRLKWIKEKAPGKALAIMLDEKDTNIEDLERLLVPINGHVDWVRLAVKPERMGSALILAEAIRSLNLKVAFNLMYISKLVDNHEIKQQIIDLEGKVDCFNAVDSYGGIYPSILGDFLKELRPHFKKTLLGYHGHNNMELAFANSLVALENGCDIVDGTITGMGRGAGNLKTELWLTWLANNKGVTVDFNALSTITEQFEQLQKEYDWGTKLAYMVSGANSLPQQDVMEWVSNRAYSLNSIVQALDNQKRGQEDNQQLPVFAGHFEGTSALIVGGGPSVGSHKQALKEFIKNSADDICLIHASATNAAHFQDIPVPQYYCLVGNEGYRLEKVFKDFTSFYGKCVLPPYPRKMGTYVPPSVADFTNELKSVTFTDSLQDSHTALALQVALDLNVQHVWLTGYDGYQGNMSIKEQDLYNENNYLFAAIAEHVKSVIAITPTRYKKLKQQSVYALNYE